MNLRRRLERLRQAQNAKSLGDGIDVPSALTGENEKATTDLEQPAPGARQKALDSLREQLRQVIGGADTRSATQGMAPAAQRREISALPFVEVQTQQGRLLQRRVTLSAGLLVGKRSLGAAVRASPRYLAQLALDEKIAGTDPCGWLFFDTETTGLGGAGTLAFLVGFASLNADGSVVVEQLLLREPEDEPALLARVVECFEQASALVSFNGKAFDRPLLSSRCVMSRQPELAVLPHLDLLHIGRRLHQSRLGKCNLGRIEKFVLGFERGEDIAGSEIPPIYGHFLRTGDATQVEQVVEHNYWDVLSMVALVGMYGEAHCSLVATDLAGLARTQRRAGAIDAATQTAELACQRGGGGDALRIRALLAKTRGDRDRATEDYERLVAVGEDPAACLELAKLYEHSWRLPERALDWVCRGTSEDPAQTEHRRQRLHRKIRRRDKLG